MYGSVEFGFRQKREDFKKFSLLLSLASSSRDQKKRWENDKPTSEGVRDPGQMTRPRPRTGIQSSDPSGGIKVRVGDGRGWKKTGIGNRGTGTDENRAMKEIKVLVAAAEAVNDGTGGKRGSWKKKDERVEDESPIFGKRIRCLGSGVLRTA